MWLLNICFILPGIPVFAEPPVVEEVLGVLGMDKAQITELAQGQPVAYALSEESSDELGAGVVWYTQTPLTKVAGHLRLTYPDSLDVNVTAHGLLTEHGGVDSLASVVLSKKEAQALLDAEPGEEFNLSTDEIISLQSVIRTPPKAIEDAVGQHYRKILFKRFEAYRNGGTFALAPYAREDDMSSRPSQELHQAAIASAILARYFPALHKAWLNYPQVLPPGTEETFPWVKKNVEGRSAAVLRHRVTSDWNGGVLVLTREYYAMHSFNSSQWITGCLPYRDGTLVFQQIHSYTDQVTGIASSVKHVVGRKLLKDKMLKSFERLCYTLGQCR